MKIIIFGGDGFCGWPTSLRLAASGHEVLIVDNLSRRSIDDEIKSNSLTNIFSIEERIKVAKKKIGNISFINHDISSYESLKNIFLDYKPSAVVHFAEQRAAPYSMISGEHRCYTINNNITNTHNICSAIVETNKDIRLIHLGTMGVYGYNKDYGVIPEGYLNIKINSTKKDVDILYPPNPGSIYHLTKTMDQLIFQYYNKNWLINITDLHQGIVWGAETEETKLDPVLVNRFDYDGIYGTVLNRMVVQAANNHPLTVYGEGGQKRAFIHISDTAKCIKLAIESNNYKEDKVRIFNQVSEVKSVLELANIIKKLYGSEIKFYENPRNELSRNDLEVKNDGLVNLGFDPIFLNKSLIEDIKYIAEKTADNFNIENVLNSPKWK